MRTINKIIIHCSDSDIAGHDNVETIRKWHVEERGWSDIGYHYIITKDGKIHIGRPVHIKGAHCKGQNHDSIGICLTGKNDFSPEQFESLHDIKEELKFEFGLNDSDFYPHNYFDSKKTCPNFELKGL